MSTANHLHKLSIASASMLLAICFSTPARSVEKHHNIGLFVGIYDHHETDTVIGLEYEYQFDASWGVGGSFENIKDAHHGDGIDSKIISGYFHPDNHWRVGLGVGKEKVKGDHSVSENLIRIGTSYDFQFKDFGIAPSLNIDHVNGENIKVYGVALVVSF